MFETKAQDRSSNEGIYLKVGITLGSFGFDTESLIFGLTTVDVDMSSGMKLFFGSGIGGPTVDFELTGEQSLSYGLFAKNNQNSSANISVSTWQTNIYGTGLYKIYNRRGDFLRFGGGPTFTLPSILKIEFNDVSQGQVKYGSAFGAHIVVDYMIKSKNVFVIPGMRINFSRLFSSSTSFTNPDNLAEIAETGNGSFGIYVMGRF